MVAVIPCSEESSHLYYSWISFLQQSFGHLSNQQHIHDHGMDKETTDVISLILRQIRNLLIGNNVMKVLLIDLGMDTILSMILSLPPSMNEDVCMWVEHGLVILGSLGKGTKFTTRLQQNSPIFESTTQQ